MLKRLYSSFLVLAVASLNLWGQADSSQVRLLSEFKILTEQRVNDLQEYISQIGNKELSIEQRQMAIDWAVDLFEKDHMVNGKRRSPCIYVSRRDGTVVPVPVRAYFNNLLGIKFDKVEIVSYDLYVLSAFQNETGNNGYHVATYFHRCKGFDKNGKMIYESKDRREISASAKRAVYKELGKEALTLFFGDITVKETL